MKIRRTYKSLEDLRISDFDLLNHYLGINKIPCLIQSPLRQDRSPSFSLYTRDGESIFYKDFATDESGGMLKLLSNLWGISQEETLGRINKEEKKIIYDPGKSGEHLRSKKGAEYNINSSLSIVKKPWEIEDTAYWMSYGVSQQLARFSDVIPISHIIFSSNEGDTLYKTAKLAYAFMENKEGKTTYKIYQPKNKKIKWLNKHDASVISLWTKIPQEGEELIICSSLKDALCVWNQTGIPCLSLQGEGYMMSKTAIDNLKGRYTNIYVLFDRDEAGVKGGRNLSKATGFKYIELPNINGSKDPSDLYKSLEDKKSFKNIITSLLE